MQKAVEMWIRLKTPVAVLRKMIVGEGVKQYLIDFLDKSGKYNSCNVLFDEYKIYGIPGSKHLKKLESFGEYISNPQDDVSLFDILDANTVKFDTKSEWVKSRPLPLNERKLKAESLARCSGVMDQIFSVNVGDFKIVGIDMISFKELCVYFALRGHMYSPLRIMIGEPTLMRPRNYKGTSEEFREFVSEITNITGGVYWTEED